MINKEILQMICIGSGGVLFMVGGFRWKWLRRFLLPVLFSACVLMAGHEGRQALIIAGGYMLAFCLPYGDKTNNIVRFLIFCCFIIPSIELGFTLWQIISPIIIFITMLLSRWKTTQNIIFHKAWEFITGTTIGITIASLL